MDRFAITIALICVGGAFALDLEKGYEMATKSAKGMCWYEYLKIKPTAVPKSDNFSSCSHNLNFKVAIEKFEKAGVKRFDYRVIKPNLATNMNSFMEKFAPIQYTTNCKEYLDDPEKMFEKNYSSILNDSSEQYPYRGWSHCLIGQMEETHSDEAIDAMKEKWSSPNHPWINEVFNRENENRERHDVPLLKLNKDLSALAQKWADQLVEKCGEISPKDHIPGDHPDAQYEGKQMGENLARMSFTPEIPPEDQALDAADGWYEEIRDYPWPEYKGKGTDPLFYKIGHFTASMWKGSEQVGYGLATKPGCKNTYVVGRYWPGGNSPGKFKENILPPNY